MKQDMLIHLYYLKPVDEHIFKTYIYNTQITYASCNQTCIVQPNYVHRSLSKETTAQCLQNVARLNVARLNVARLNVARLNVARLNVARLNVARLNVARLNVVFLMSPDQMLPDQMLPG
jgi:hypothetical protein